MNGPEKGVEKSLAKEEQSLAKEEQWLAKGGSFVHSANICISAGLKGIVQKCDFCPFSVPFFAGVRRNVWPGGNVDGRRSRRERAG